VRIAEIVAQRVFGSGLRIVSRDPVHGHMAGLLGGNRLYIIYTTRVLENSRAMFSADYGEMLGVRTTILMQNYDYIVWVVNRGSRIDVYMEKSSSVYRFCRENTTVYRNRETGENICNYPAALAKNIETIIVQKTLDSYKSK
jgi:hypothetical protein